MKENTQPIIQRLRKGLGAQGFSQAVNLVIRLAEVPLFLAYWWAERYGEWLMVAAIPARGVHLGQKALDSPHRHAARVHGDDLLNWSSSSAGTRGNAVFAAAAAFTLIGMYALFGHTMPQTQHS